MRHRVFRWCFWSGLVLCAPMPAAAALDAEACTRLKREQEQLTAAGVKEAMARGPEWAKANLPADRLEQIRQFIAIGEQLLFQCPQPKPPPEVTAAAGAEDKEKEKEKSGAVPPATKVPKRAPSVARDRAPETVPAKTTPAPKPKAPAADEGIGKKQVQPSRPKKPKANDAYVPPPKETSPLGGLDAQAARQGGAGIEKR